MTARLCAALVLGRAPHGRRRTCRRGKGTDAATPTPAGAPPACFRDSPMHHHAHAQLPRVYSPVPSALRPSLTVHTRRQGWTYFQAHFQLLASHASLERKCRVSDFITPPCRHAQVRSSFGYGMICPLRGSTEIHRSQVRAGGVESATWLRRTRPA